jgi:hypothetical protein
MYFLNDYLSDVKTKNEKTCVLRDADRGAWITVDFAPPPPRQTLSAKLRLGIEGDIFDNLLQKWTAASP